MSRAALSTTMPPGGVKTFVWLLAAGSDGNEYDEFGFIHGLTNHDDDFTPRPVFSALQTPTHCFPTQNLIPPLKLSARIDVATFIQL